MVVGLAAGFAPAAVADAYLDMIEAETEKIAGPLPTVVDGEAGAESEEDAGFQEFLAYLKEESLGSYTFFEKLTPAQRSEVFERHKQGASLEQIREIIMERFLKR